MHLPGVRTLWANAPSQKNTMRISIYTFIKNGLYFDFHTVAMLRHHARFADEIVVNEGHSSDGTFEAIENLDPKVHVYRNEWDRSDPSTWHVKFKNWARLKCTGDWCILLDSDEFIPEWEFDRLRTILETTDKDILPVRFLHFYGNYRVHVARRNHNKTAPLLGNRIHRNVDSIFVWGDGANVRREGHPYPEPRLEEAFECHHFGEVRRPARLRQKWRIQAKQHDDKNPRWDRVPSWLFNLFPYKWEITSDLDIYEGPLIGAVREDPSEFVRDGFHVYNVLCRQRATSEAACVDGGLSDSRTLLTK